jgi:hypothetical protein
VKGRGVTAKGGDGQGGLLPNVSSRLRRTSPSGNVVVTAFRVLFHHLGFLLCASLALWTDDCPSRATDSGRGDRASPRTDMSSTGFGGPPSSRCGASSAARLPRRTLSSPVCRVWGTSSWQCPRAVSRDPFRIDVTDGGCTAGGLALQLRRAVRGGESPP